MAYYTPTREETFEDRKLYLEGRLVTVACLDCLAEVRVKKNSEHHTSIQWSQDAVAHCAEFARDRATGERVVHESCSRLKASIETAYREGRITAGDGTLEPDD
jgi:hypothetical protein